MDQQDLNERRPSGGRAHDHSGEARAVCVIADTGISAEIVVLPSSFDLAPGSLFRHRGSHWVVTGKRRDSGLWAATPVEH